jgi:flagellar hook-associated protein 3 FlgL
MTTVSTRPSAPPVRTAVLASADLCFRQRVRDTLVGLRWQVREAAGGAEALAYLQGDSAEVLSLANSSYLGQYIFAGSQSGTQPFTLNPAVTPNTVTYNGDGDISYVQTPAGQRIQLNVPGDQIFTAPGANVLGSLNALIADFSSGAPSATSIADLASLSSALGYVDQQRTVIDNSINRLTASSNYASQESVQLLSAQDNLIQTDTASVASQLSTAETQQVALTQVIAALDQQGNLFQRL